MEESMIDFKQGPNPLAVPAVKTSRRVGTTTMGFALVALGAVLVAGQLGLVDTLQMLCWMPALLILLGFEVLLHSLFSGGRKLRYDVLSMLLCFLLVIGSAACGILPTIFGSERNYRLASEQISQQLEQQIAGAVGAGNIANMHVSVWYEGYQFESRIPSVEELAAQNNYEASVQLSLTGEYETAEDFAKSVEQAAGKIAALSLPVDYYTFFSYSETSEYSISLDNWGLGLSAKELAVRVEDNGTRYDEAYQAGIEEGKGIGYDEAYEEGRLAGIEEGKAAGYDEAYEEGRLVGIEEGKAVGYDEAYEEGRLAGIEEGKNIG
ncbi:MAG: hypothetical protein HFE45_06575 [Oscillospiraceae bacterium]|jgi:hypothetical protein|nr:hypothetical protein [Oscillospiraceae bacterium]